MILLSLLSAWAACAAAAQERDAGIVERIVGRASWRKNDGVRPTALRPGTDSARRLHVGESVKAGPGGTLALILCDGRRELHERDGWLKIQETSACQGGDALAEYGGIGGRDRGGEEPLIYSPANNEVIRPESFTLRWKPSPELSSFTAKIIKFDDDSVVWGQRVVNGATGVLQSAEVRQALALARSNSDAVRLVLMVRGARSLDTRVTFALLGVGEERELNRQLARWDADPSPLMRRLGRAAAFISRSMFADGAAEYEAALARAPRSHDLLVRTIQAQCDAANEPRVKELMKHLLPGGPDPCEGEPSGAAP